MRVKLKDPNQKNKEERGDSMSKEHKNKSGIVGEMNLKNRIGRVIVWIILLAGVCVIMYPLLWMLATSLRSVEEYYTAGTSLIVKEFKWSNYYEALTTFPFLKYFKNTMIVTVFGIVFSCTSCSLVAFGFARYQAPGSKLLFMMMMGTMMLPGQVMMIPNFIIMKKIGWYNSLYPLFMTAIFASAGGVFLIRQFYMRLPDNLEEAAKMDGASPFRIWWQIYLPLSKPVIVTIAIAEFMGRWNSIHMRYILILVSRRNIHTQC